MMRAIVMLTVAGLLTAGPALAQTEERTVYAGVVDKSGAHVPGLSASDFLVRENDLTREVLRVSPATEPMQIALLVDTSQAIDPHVLDIRNALRAFIKQMAGRHEMAMIGFGERPTTIVDLTRDAARLEKGIGSIFPRPGSGSYLLEAIIETADAFARRKPARPHIIVYSSRGPEFSDRFHADVLDALRESGATLHSLIYSRPGAAMRSQEEQELELALANGTRMSGGRRDELLTSMALADRLAEIGRELENQYAVTYARPRTLLPPKTIEVDVKRPDLTVRAPRWP